MKSIAAVVLSTLLLAGCATSPVAVTEAQMAPPGRLMNYQTTPTTPYATLVVVRDSGLLARACRVGVYIDGQFVASLTASEKAEFRVPLDRQILSLGADMIENSGCIWRQAPSQHTLQLRAGETQTFRINGDSSQGFVLAPAA